MGRKCRVKDCLSDSKRSEDVGVTFHKIPNHSDIRPKWLTLCKIPLENNSNKIIYVCSRHFRKHDFCQFKGTKYMLKQGVLPSIFPWTDLNEIKSKILSESKSDSSSSNKLEESEVTSQMNLKTDINVSASTKPEALMHITQKDSEEEVIKEECESQSDQKSETEKSNTKLESTMPSSFKCFKEEFSQGMRVEATDFNGIWFPAKVLEVDQSENEVFIQFEKSANRSNEWIPMDSKRLRPLQVTTKKQSFEIGERVMAMWTNSMKFRATVEKVLDDGDSYEVLFDDGIKSILKSAKISKPTSTIDSAVPRPHPSPLFAPVESTKQERRDRKRKIIVSELFHKKRVKQDVIVQPVPVAEKNTSCTFDKPLIEKPRRASDAKTTVTNVLANNLQPEAVPNTDEWICQWINGQPVGTPGVIDSRKSVIVTDHRLPPGWIKHLVCRSQGFSAGKWDTILVNADGRKFRSKNEIKSYLEQEKSSYSLDQFDFGLHLKRARSLGMFKVTEKSASPIPKDNNSAVTKQTTVLKSQSPKQDLKDVKSPERLEDTETFTDDENCENTLKIVCEDGGYKCPIEGCGKNFRRENLAQMHIKHYHPEFSKFIGSTPNVADLAYARTVGEPIEDFVLKGRVSQGVSDKKSEPVQKTPTRTESKFQIKSLNVASQVAVQTEKKSPVQIPKTVDKIEGTSDKPQPTTPKLPKQESEIIKLLNSETKIPKTPDAYKIESKLSKNDTILTANVEQTTNSSKSPIIVTPLDPIKTETVKPIDVETKEAIKSPDSIFKRDESRSSGGIKTLLPVIRVTSENQRKSNEDQPQLLEIDNLNKLQITSTPVIEKTIKTNRKRYISEADIHKKRKYTKHDYSYLSDPRDSDSRSPDYTGHAKNKKKSVDFADVPTSSTTASQDVNQHIITENGEVIKIEQMKQEEIVNCTCGFMEEDGLMIQCELCLCWQHAYCNNIEREDQVPEKYICYICKNPLRMRSSQKYVHDQDWLKKGVLPTANYHSVDKEVLNERFENLRRSHELSGNLNELKSVLHSLKVKIKIAQNKDHPKFYLWSKPWEKTNILHNVKDLLDNQQNKSDIKDKSLCSNQTFVNCTEEEISTHNDIELSLKNLLNCSSDSLKRETDNKMPFDDNLAEVSDIKDVNPSQQTAQDLLQILEGTDILKHSETETLVEESSETDISKGKLLNTEYSKLDLNSLLVNTNIDSVNVDIDIKSERGTSVNDLTATINPNELEAVLRSDLSEDKVLTPLDEHSKSAFYDTIKSENKSVTFTTDAADVSMHSGVISSGEVSDGELMSQALAGELLSSPTTALNLNFTQSDIDTIEKSIRIPEAPQPEAKIEPEVCRQNLIDNIRHYQQLVKERMNAVEEEIAILEAQDPTPENEGNINETVTMMLRDLSQMQKLAALY